MPRRRPCRLVTLTSDLGSAYSAQMKAALVARGVPPRCILDLAHDLRAHGIREAAFLLRTMASSFPAYSVHVAVVDPGVGGRRQPVVVTTRAGPILVGPDNGVLSLLADELGFRSAHRIVRSRVGRSSRVGTTFDGRDLFAPAAALVARGTQPRALGPSTDFARVSIPAPTRRHGSMEGEVVHVDHFGNLITSLPSAWVSRGTQSVVLRLGSRRPQRVAWATSYEALGRGMLGALASSFGLVEIAVSEGRASDRLRAGTGTRVALASSVRAVGSRQTIYGRRPRKRE